MWTRTGALSVDCTAANKVSGHAESRQQRPCSRSRLSQLNPDPGKKSPSESQNAMAPALTREQVATAQLDGDYAIKSEKSAPALDTSQWPLLLKNYDKLLVRSSHFTPIPSGCSPLKRDIATYVKYVRMD